MVKALIPWQAPPVEVVRGEGAYPPGLLDLVEPPLTFRHLGPLPPLGPDAVAIVGTRHPSDEAAEFAFRLAAELASLGLTIVSGGALGIDAAAHQGALSAGGSTVVVLASGLRLAYPRRHAELFREVLAAGQGALLSEAADHWAPHAGLFLRRNRLIAALCGTTVVVQGAVRSGALSTARIAMELKRRVFSVPGSPWDPRSAGTLALLSEGGEICTSARDVLSLRPRSSPAEAEKLRAGCERVSNSEELQGDAGRLFRRVAQSPVHPDRISRELDISLERVHELLLSLELAGLIRRRTDGRYGPVSASGA